MKRIMDLIVSEVSKVKGEEEKTVRSTFVWSKKIFIKKYDNNEFEHIERLEKDISNEIRDCFFKEIEKNTLKLYAHLNRHHYEDKEAISMIDDIRCTLDYIFS